MDFSYLFDVAIMLASGSETNLGLQTAQSASLLACFMFHTEIASFIRNETRSYAMKPVLTQNHTEGFY